MSSRCFVAIASEAHNFSFVNKKNGKYYRRIYSFEIQSTTQLHCSINALIIIMLNFSSQLIHSHFGEEEKINMHHSIGEIIWIQLYMFVIFVSNMEFSINSTRSWRCILKRKEDRDRERENKKQGKSENNCSFFGWKENKQYSFYLYSDR